MSPEQDVVASVRARPVCPKCGIRGLHWDKSRGMWWLYQLNGAAHRGCGIEHPVREFRPYAKGFTIR